MMVPKEEKYTSNKKELTERIIGLLGGRVAEELFLMKLQRELIMILVKLLK
jgi:ATP-dependent Zn protease